MVLAEFTSMTAIYEATPDFCPHPIAWGSYVSINKVYFFLCEFHELTGELPDVHSFPARLADLHRIGTSLNGRFGFSCTTYHGNTPINHGWADTWEEYFTTRTKVLLEMEQESQGPNEEIMKLSVPFFQRVVPRLLRPLETGGRTIKPCLVHGDLWHGNSSTDTKTGLPIIYDVACFYAHNEYDLGVWRAPWNNIGREYVDSYLKHFPISDPIEDHDDRNLLYATRVNILDSILYKEDTSYREQLIADMKRLVEKFPEGNEGWQRTNKTAKDASIVGGDDSTQATGLTR